MIKDNIYICDYCGKDSGEFDEETGNHVLCQDYATLKDKANRFVFWVDQYLKTRVGHSPLVMMDAEKEANAARSALVSILEKGKK